MVSQGWDDNSAAELRRSLAPLHAAQELAEMGDHAELLKYLGGRSRDELEQSPMLALLYGVGHSRGGQFDEGQRWVDVALSRARVLGDRILETRSLNVCGAIAMERGEITEATSFFTWAQEAAMQDNDMATLGRCANNLGIIANLRGDYGQAIGAYTRAIAAYQQVHYDRGIAESHHNLGITYRELGRHEDALQAADAAVSEAARLGDRRLQAQAIAGRAEIHTARGEWALAVLEAEQALSEHRELGDAVRETEDLRILAAALARTGASSDAADLLREVLHRASQQGRPLLVAMAQRDLASVHAGQGEIAAATLAADSARATFEHLGAKAEIEKLNTLLGHADVRERPGYRDLKEKRP